MFFLIAPAETTPDIMRRITEEYSNQIFRMCYFYLKDWQLAEDAVQDTLLKVYKKYYTFDGAVSEKTWIIQIAINTCKDYLRTHWYKNRFFGLNDDINTSENSDEPIYKSDKNKIILKLVMNLKQNYKDVILLYYYQEMQISEIAYALKCPVGTVCVRLKRARKILEKDLKGVDLYE